MIKARLLIRQLAPMMMVALYAPCALADSHPPISLAQQSPITDSPLSQNKGFLWEVSDSNSSIYLLGSVHLANTDYYPMSNAINAAFEASDTLAVEVDITNLDPIRTHQLLLHMGSYKDPHTVKDELSPETYQKLETYLENARLPMRLVEKQRPGMLIMSLSSIELAKLGMSPQFGIDQHFLTLAKGNKPIIELESLQQQLDLLLNIEDPDQAMTQALEEFPSFPELARKLLNAWKSGDATQMEQLLIDEPLQKYPDSKAFFDKMFTARNLTMAEKIKGFLAENNRVFVVTGAGHLIGEQGVVSLLKVAGFKTQRH
jgi:uncharacterized protein